MTAALIADLCAGRFRDPRSGTKPAIGVRQVAIDIGLASAAPDLLAALDFGPQLLLVDDEAGHEAAGAEIARHLSGRYRLKTLTFPGRAAPEAAHVETLRREALASDALIAIGSGSINDLCKAAAAESDRPYAVFGIAPSMNGYVSGSASLIVAGRKISRRARPPVAVFLDLDLLAKAPRRLIVAGLGDSLCRSTAEADWRLSHLLRDTPFDPLPFALLRGIEDELFAAAGGLLAGDRQAMRLLAETLVLSGFGMTIAGGSYPASQSEHAIAHYVEMMENDTPPGHAPTFHGEEIAVATLPMAELQMRIVEGPPPIVTADRWSEADSQTHFGIELGAACWRDFAKKRLSPAEAEARTARLAHDWPKIAAALRTNMKSAAELRRVMQAVGGPLRPAAIGWSGDLFRRAFRHARYIRDRFGFLDLAAQSGYLDPFVAELG